MGLPERVGQIHEVGIRDGDVDLPRVDRMNVNLKEERATSEAHLNPIETKLACGRFDYRPAFIDGPSSQ